MSGKNDRRGNETNQYVEQHAFIVLERIVETEMIKKNKYCNYEHRREIKVNDERAGI